MIYDLAERRVTFEGDYYVAPNATLIGSVVMGHESSVWFNVVIRGDNDVITIGPGTNVQDGSVLHTDEGIALTLGKRVTVGHMVMLHGCTVGDNTLVGINSVILNGAVIGKNCIVGANTLIAEGKEIPDGKLVLGSPGRIVRSLSDEEILALSDAADHYIENAQAYRSHLLARD
jgi:carbonic anhydrase/acetyltransferase-like protein (isoleucine patch superfamily)